MNAHQHTHQQLALWTADGVTVEDGILLTRSQLGQWAGVTLSDDAMARLADNIPRSSVPEAITTIVNDAMGIWPKDDTTSEFEKYGAEVLLCDECWEAGTGLPAECQDCCNLPLDHDGECAPYRRGGQDYCDNCGTIDRLTRELTVNLDSPEAMSLLLPEREAATDSEQDTWNVWLAGQRVAAFGTASLADRYVSLNDGTVYVPGDRPEVDWEHSLCIHGKDHLAGPGYHLVQAGDGGATCDEHWDERLR